MSLDKFEKRVCCNLNGQSMAGSIPFPVKGATGKNCDIMSQRNMRLEGKRLHEYLAEEDALMLDESDGVGDYIAEFLH